MTILINFMQNDPTFTRTPHEHAAIRWFSVPLIAHPLCRLCQKSHSLVLLEKHHLLVSGWLSSYLFQDGSKRMATEPSGGDMGVPKTRLDNGIESLQSIYRMYVQLLSVLV